MKFENPSGAYQPARAVPHESLAKQVLNRLSAFCLNHITPRTKSAAVLISCSLLIGNVPGDMSIPEPTSVQQDSPHNQKGQQKSAEPTRSVVFNNPYGSVKEQRKVIDTIAEGVVNAPAGSTVRLAAFSYTLPDFTDKVIDANNRGVNIHIIADNLYYDGSREQAKNTRELERMKKALGTKVTADSGSYIKICKDACLSDGIMHAKISTFSETGGKKYVVEMGSSNLDGFQTKAWNNIVKIDGDKKLYDKSVQYFEDMAKDPGKGNWYSETTSGNNTLITYPRTDYKTLKQDQYYNDLSKVKCNEENGPAVVDLAMFQWTKTRLDVARKASELATFGCDVNIIISGTSTSPEILAELTRNKNLQVADADSHFDNGVPGIFNHNKILITDLNNGKPNAKTVLTGSQNLSISAIKKNAELTLVIKDPAIHKKYQDYFRIMWKKSRLISATDDNKVT